MKRLIYSGDVLIGETDSQIDRTGIEQVVEWMPEQLPDVEFYYKRKGVFFFRTRYGGRIIVKPESKEGLTFLNSLKKGDKGSFA